MIGRKRTAAARGKPSDTKLSAKSPKKAAAAADEADDTFVDDNISDDGPDSDDEPVRKNDESSSDESDVETAEQKRLRLAKAYLKKLGSSVDRAGEDGEVSSDSDADDDGLITVSDEVAKKLAAKHAAEQGFSFHNVAGKIARDTEYLSTLADKARLFRGHGHSVTCTAISADERYVFSGAKDCSIIQWDLATGAKVWQVKGKRLRKGEAPPVIARADPLNQGQYVGEITLNRTASNTIALNPDDAHHHTHHVLALATSDDGRYLASAGVDVAIKLWDLRTRQAVEELRGHKKAVTGLVFRRGSSDLYSSSLDRTVKVWNCEAHAYVDTLYGHTGEVYSIDALRRERGLSVGQDRCARVWKILEQSQLMFQPAATMDSLDCGRMITETNFITGSQDGALMSWTMQRRKPCGMIPAEDAHGPGMWICSVAALPYTDLVASGSYNGFINLYNLKTETAKHHFEKIAEIPVEGVINSLQFSRSGRFLIAGVGQEHRLGRWIRVPAARNGIRVIPLPASVHRTLSG